MPSKGEFAIPIEMEEIIAAVEKYGSAREAAKHLTLPGDTRPALTAAAISARIRKMPKNHPLVKRYNQAKGSRALSRKRKTEALEKELRKYLPMVRELGGVRNVERRLDKKKGQISGKLYRLPEDNPVRRQYQEIIDEQRVERAKAQTKGEYLSTDELIMLIEQHGTINAVARATGWTGVGIKRRIVAWAQKENALEGDRLSACPVTTDIVKRALRSKADDN